MWDGSDEDLLPWLQKVNTVAEKLETMRQQLGKVIPFRLEGEANDYFYSLSRETQLTAQESWDEI